MGHKERFFYENILNGALAAGRTFCNSFETVENTGFLVIIRPEYIQQIKRYMNVYLLPMSVHIEMLVTSLFIFIVIIYIYILQQNHM